jgi:alpha-tubulin suppressor-like RCC1 family protein
MRLPLLAAALALSFGLTGCGGDPEATGPGPDVPQAATTTALTFIHVTTGAMHSCGVTSDHRAWCWGDNERGQVGTGGTTPGYAVAWAVAGGLRFLDVTAGDWHTCGITTDNLLYCWGLDDAGQLGTGGGAPCSGGVCRSPVAVAGSRHWRQVSAGVSHTCGVTTAFKVFCWGDGSEGQVGTGDSLVHRSPAAVKSGLQFRQVTAGRGYTCALTTASRAYCWGRNDTGTLGNGTKVGRPTPGPVSGGLTFRKLSAGYGHICGVALDADVAYCWGHNLQGTPGTNHVTNLLKPTPVKGGVSFIRVSAGLEYTCGIDPSSRAWCWGRNALGSLGNGTFQDSPWPTAVVGGRTWLEVRAGPDAMHTCGVAYTTSFDATPPTSGQALCWGWNAANQIGDQTLTNRKWPVAIIPPM